MLSAGLIDPYKGKMATTARRATNYHHMREVMADPANWSRTSTVYGLTVAAIAEDRAADIDLARKHLRIAINLLNHHEGLRTIQTMTLAEGSIILSAFVNISLPLFRHRRDIEEAFKKLEENIQALNSVVIDVKLPQGLRQYFSSHQPVQWGPQMAILHLLTLTLSRCSSADGQEFLRQLDHMAKSSQGAGPLTSLAILFMLCACAAKMGWWNNSQQTPFRCWETIKLVALMGFAPISRGCVIDYLARRLLTGVIARSGGLQLVKAEVFRDTRLGVSVDDKPGVSVLTNARAEQAS